MTVWTTTTCQQRPLFLGPEGGRCKEVWLYFEWRNPQYYHNNLNLWFSWWLFRMWNTRKLLYAFGKNRWLFYWQMFKRKRMTGKKDARLTHIYRSLEKLIKTHHLAPVQRNLNEKSFLCCDFAFFVYATIFAKLLSKKWRYRKVLIIIAWFISNERDFVRI